MALVMPPKKKKHLQFREGRRQDKWSKMQPLAKTKLEKMIRKTCTFREHRWQVRVCEFFAPEAQNGARSVISSRFFFTKNRPSQNCGLPEQGLPFCVPL